MLFLNVYGSTDPFSHQMHFLRSMNAGDYSPKDIETTFARYVREYEAEKLSCLSAMIVEINCETNTVTTKQNFRAFHPLKTKKIVNPSAGVVRDTRLNCKKVSIVSPQPMTFNELVANMPVNIVEGGQF